MKFKDRLKNISINEVTFFRVGFWCFLIMGVANVIQNFILYPSPYVFGMVASGASAFFNFIVALFFRHLLKNFEGTKVDSIDDLQKAIEDFK